MLKELELGYYFIQNDLLDFLGAHSSTLAVRKPFIAISCSMPHYRDMNPPSLVSAESNEMLMEEIAFDIKSVLAPRVRRR